ncbi:MAG: hypothetical protein LCH46_07555 [Proteobacteria bacterium]|nr:hypothetical protein [Pseudomonadota bacterium]
MFRILGLSGLAVLAAGASMLASLPAAALETPTFTACRDYASATADKWSADEIIRAGEAAKTRPNSYVAIIYGKKYFVPLQNGSRDDLKPKPLGQRAIERKHVYYEELNRCLQNS